MRTLPSIALIAAAIALLAASSSVTALVPTACAAAASAASPPVLVGVASGRVVATPAVVLPGVGIWNGADTGRAVESTCEPASEHRSTTRWPASKHRPIARGSAAKHRPIACGSAPVHRSVAGGSCGTAMGQGGWESATSPSAERGLTVEGHDCVGVHCVGRWEAERRGRLVGRRDVEAARVGLLE